MCRPLKAFVSRSSGWMTTWSALMMISSKWRINVPSRCGTRQFRSEYEYRQCVALAEHVESGYKICRLLRSTARIATRGMRKCCIRWLGLALSYLHDSTNPLEVVNHGKEEYSKTPFAELALGHCTIGPVDHISYRSVKIGSRVRHLSPVERSGLVIGWRCVPCPNLWSCRASL